MKLRSLMLIAAAVGLGLAANAAWAQQKTTGKSDAAGQVDAKEATTRTDGTTEADVRKERDAAKSRKDTANARAAARNAKQGKELEEEEVPQQ